MIHVLQPKATEHIEILSELNNYGKYVFVNSVSMSGKELLVSGTSFQGYQGRLRQIYF